LQSRHLQFLNEYAKGLFLILKLQFTLSNNIEGITIQNPKSKHAAGKKTTVYVFLQMFPLIMTTTQLHDSY